MRNEMLECSVCEKKTEDLDWCAGCGFLCEDCDHQED